MLGFKGNRLYLQEHWLIECELHYLSGINIEFCYYVMSAMNLACENGIQIGRPFGSVGVLWQRSLQKHILSYETDGDCRVLSSMQYGAEVLLLFGCYNIVCSDYARLYWHNLLLTRVL